MKLGKFLRVLYVDTMLLILNIPEWALLYVSAKDLQEKGWNTGLFLQSSGVSKLLLYAWVIPLLLGVFALFELIIRKIPMTLYGSVKMIYAHYFTAFVFISFEIFEWNMLLEDWWESATYKRRFNNAEPFLVLLVFMLMLKIYSRSVVNMRKVVAGVIPFLKICGLAIVVLGIVSVMKLGWSWNTFPLFFLMFVKCVVVSRFAKYIVNYYRRNSRDLLIAHERGW